jgi:hypothetical protein
MVMIAPIPSTWLESKPTIDIFGQPCRHVIPVIYTRVDRHLLTLSQELATTRDAQARISIHQAIIETEAILFWLNGINDSTFS